MTERITVAGIDPASTTGLVCLSVDANRPHDGSRWLWVASRTIAASARSQATKTENKLALFDHARAWLHVHGVAHAVLERPADNIPRGWKGKGQNKAGAQSAEVGFAIGEAFGMLASAARAAGCARVFSYPATSAKEKPGKRKARVGWMPMTHTGRLVHVQAREKTLARLQQIANDIMAQPYGGVLLPIPPQLDENVLMAFGVLSFHLSRQPGI